MAGNPIAAAMSAEVAIDRRAPGRLRIAMREGEGAILGFVAFVTLLAAALYTLMPEARAHPTPLIGLVAVAIGWAVVARRGREEYVLDQTTRSLTVRRAGLLGRREEQLPAGEISAVRCTRAGVDDNRLVVELIGANGKARLRLPRGINTLSAEDQANVGRLLAEHLRVPVMGG